MALATSTIVALAIAAAAAGASAYNTNQTAKRTDAEAATGIRKQGQIQKEADAKVNEEVAKLESSRSDDERVKRVNDYMTTLRNNKSHLEGGLTPNVGGDTFRADAAKAAGDVQNYGADAANLMARIDAPGMQRQGEAFDYGNLATDIGLIGRRSQGEDFLNQLRIRAIRRNPWIDAAAAFGSSYAGGMGSGGGGGGVWSTGAAGSGNQMPGG